jgi:hypothetical protein
MQGFDAQYFLSDIFLGFITIVSTQTISVISEKLLNNMCHHCFHGKVSKRPNLLSHLHDVNIIKNTTPCYMSYHLAFCVKFSFQPI